MSLTDLPDEDARGPLLASFETQPEHTRALGRLRQGVAVVAGLASLATWLGRLPVAVALVATVGAVAALAWWRVGSRDVRRATAEPPDGLWLHQHGLVARERGERRWLPWIDVTGVSVDEELLHIRVHQRHSNDLVLAGHYAGSAIEEVAGALADAAGVVGPYASEA